MNRRTFLTKDIPAAAAFGLGAAWSASAADKAVSPYYVEFHYVHMQNGSQTTRMAKWLETRLLPIWQKHAFGPVGFFNTEVGPNLPTTLMVFTYPSLAEMETLWAKLGSDPDYTAAIQESEKDEPAFYRSESVLLRSTAFSPSLIATPSSEPIHKLYELRIYESATGRQLGYLHDRFGGGEIESETQREQAWSAFRADPDWVKIRDESIRHGGEIVRNITNMLFSPLSFSMLR